MSPSLLPFSRLFVILSPVAFHRCHDHITLTCHARRPVSSMNFAFSLISDAYSAARPPKWSPPRPCRTFPAAMRPAHHPKQGKPHCGIRPQKRGFCCYFSSIRRVVFRSTAGQHSLFGILSPFLLSFYPLEPLSFDFCHLEPLSFVFLLFGALSFTYFCILSILSSFLLSGCNFEPLAHIFSLPSARKAGPSVCGVGRGPRGCSAGDEYHQGVTSHPVYRILARELLGGSLYW